MALEWHRQKWQPTEHNYISLINISLWDKLGDVHVCDQTSEKQEWCSDSSHFPTRKEC